MTLVEMLVSHHERLLIRRGFTLVAYNPDLAVFLRTWPDNSKLVIQFSKSFIELRVVMANTTGTPLYYECAVWCAEYADGGKMGEFGKILKSWVKGSVGSQSAYHCAYSRGYFRGC